MLSPSGPSIQYAARSARDPRGLSRRGASGSDLDPVLWIYALRRKHRPESALEAARLGERRLALRRTALAGAPDELAHSLRELIDIYTFEDHVLDTRRVDELRRELAAFLEAGGAQREA